MFYTAAGHVNGICTLTVFHLMYTVEGFGLEHANGGKMKTNKSKERKEGWREKGWINRKGRNEVQCK